MRSRHDDHVAKVSVVGLGMASRRAWPNRMFARWPTQDINIQMITTSEIKISVLVDRDQAQPALRAVHQAFALEQLPTEEPSPVASATAAPAIKGLDAVNVVERLQEADMEELVLDDISLDDSQSLVTIVGVPNRPGVAAALFQRVADAGIFVDMIVQSYKGYQGQISVSFTIPADQLESALPVAQELAEQFECTGVTHRPEVAKLTVSGIGLRSHTDVAIRMFRAFADTRINVDMISTSEVRVNVVVDGKYGKTGLRQLQLAFADVLR